MQKLSQLGFLGSLMKRGFVDHQNFSCDGVSKERVNCIPKLNQSVDRHAITCCEFTLVNFHLANIPLNLFLD